MTSWAPEPPIPQRFPRVGWSEDITIPPPRTPRLGWIPSWGTEGTESGIGIDRCDTIPLIVAMELAAGADRATLLTRSGGVNLSIGLDRAARTGTRQRESAIGADRAKPGVYQRDTAIGLDRVTAAPDTGGREPSIGLDRVTAAPDTGGREPSIGRDRATNRFPLLAAVASTYTATTSGIEIPYWCRYIDAIAVGGGGGGNSGNNTGADGNGGNGGVWAWWTYERGVHVPWTTITITATVGTGGGSRTNGTASSVAMAGADTLTGAGGTWKDSRGGDRDGQPPSGGNSNTVSGISRDVVHQGVTYAGGSWSNTDTANIPGAGGRGGSGSIWPLSPGSGRTGARGQVWLRFWTT